MINDNWDGVFKDQPIKIILARRLRNMVNLEDAAKKIEWFCEIAGLIAEGKSENLVDQVHWKAKYISQSVLDALVSQKGGYKAMVEISEKSPALSGAIDKIENDYGGSRITMKRITDHNRALAAEKLLKARATRRKKITQTT